jgi:hypothetical protein
MNIASAHLEALQAFGYTEEEARFLYIVATHSGYFVARQFLSFTGAHWGKRTTTFWTKLHILRHARIERFPKSGVVYHLFSRRLYRHIERENLRNRRTHELEFIKRRLAMLDFVLANQKHRYLETEPDKVGFFRNTLGLDTRHLPYRMYLGHPLSRPTMRYFVDKFPIFVSEGVPLSRLVTFTYIHEGLSTMEDFTHHIKEYLPLFRELSEFRFLYASRTDACFHKASEIFHSFVKIPLEEDIADQLLHYFRVQRAWDERQYGRLTDADLLFRSQARSRFYGGRFQAFFRGWKSGRFTDEAIRQEFGDNTRKRIVTFGTYLLKRSGPEASESEEKGCRT